MLFPALRRAGPALGPVVDWLEADHRRIANHLDEVETAAATTIFGLLIMTRPEQVSFDRYLDTIFASSNRLDACVNMLSVFLEDIDSCRDNPGQSLPASAPSIVDQVAAMAGRAQRLELRLRNTVEKRGPEFQTSELGAVLWWAGMASHKAAAAVEGVRDKMAQDAWEEAFFEIHALMYDTMSALSLLSVAEGMIQRMETESSGRERPN